MRRASLVILGASSVLLAACAAIFGITGGTLTDGGTDASADVTADGPIDAPPDVTPPDAFYVDVNSALCDGGIPTVGDPAMAAWVSGTLGHDNMTCSQSMPCATIAGALAVGRKVIYLDHATFNELVALDGGLANLTIQGGWVYDGGGGWSEQCDTSLTTIQAPEGGTASTTVLVDHADGVVFRLLTVYSPLWGGPTGGQSVYAMTVLGSNNVLLDSVTLVSETGGYGTPGSSGMNVTTCGLSGPSDGADGGSGNAGGPGSWGAQGFVPDNTATNGKSGHEGTASSGSAGACGMCGTP